MALIVSVLFFIFAESFVGVCGAKRGTETFRYAVIYLKIVTCGQVFNMLNQGLAAIISTITSSGTFFINSMTFSLPT